MPVRNVWSGNMVISRQAFDAIEGFRSGFGKRGGRSCPEDTDLCLRAAAFKPGRIWVYQPAAIVGHHVPVNRTRLRYFLRRCLHEGSGKAALARLNGPSESTSAERRYIRRVLPRGVGRRAAGSRMRRRLRRPAKHCHRGRSLLRRGRLRGGSG